MNGAWKDGLGRLTIKYPTGTANRSEAVICEGVPIGICRAPGWMVVWGPYTLKATGIDMAAVRAFRMHQARLKRRPGSERNLKYHLPHTEVA